MADFIDVEQALCDYLGDIAPTYTVTAANTELPLIQINRTGGYRNAYQDSAHVTINVASDTRGESVAIDNAIAARLSDATGVATAAGFIDCIRPSMAPMPVPFPATTDDREITSSWQVISRIQ